MSPNFPDFRDPVEPGPTPPSSDVVKLIDNPAGALKIVGWLAIAVNLIIACVLPGFAPRQRPLQRPPGMDDETFEAARLGAESAPLFDCCCITLSTLLVYPTVIIAGIRMQQRRSRLFAILGASLAMIPCSPVVLLGFPVGMWCLIVLNNRDVVAAFAANQPSR